MLVAAGLVASVASLVVRLRRARDDERRQLLWIASSAAFLALGVVVHPGRPTDPGRGGHLAGRPAVAPRPGRGPAVRGRRRAAPPASRDRPDRQPGARASPSPPALAAVGYVLVVVLVGLVVDGRPAASGPPWWRRPWWRWRSSHSAAAWCGSADRLAFGAAAAPYEALADFSRRLGDSPDPADLLPAVADAAARAVNARRVRGHAPRGGGPGRGRRSGRSDGHGGRRRRPASRCRWSTAASAWAASR